MRFSILMGSPRLGGNTAELCKPFREELARAGAEVEYITLADKTIASCKACYACQDVAEGYGCVQHDDMYPIFDALCRADCIVLATPIYTWFCPAEMKRVLDRHFGMNKFYRGAQGSFLAGKSMALLLTHGYEADFACTPFVTAMEHFCEHSSIGYLGMYSVRDLDDLASFQTAEAVAGARAFAARLVETLKAED